MHVVNTVGAILLDVTDRISLFCSVASVSLLLLMGDVWSQMSELLAFERRDLKI